MPATGLTISAANAPIPVTRPSAERLARGPAAASTIRGNTFWMGAISATLVPKFASISVATKAAQPGRGLRGRRRGGLQS